MRKPTMWFPNRSDTNRAVQAQAGNFGSRKKRHCIIRVAKSKALISFAVTAKLICAFVFACADCLFSDALAHIEANMSASRDNRILYVNHRSNIIK